MSLLVASARNFVTNILVSTYPTIPHQIPMASSLWMRSLRMAFVPRATAVLKRCQLVAF
jgi:hypothetical protein